MYPSAQPSLLASAQPADRGTDNGAGQQVGSSDRADAGTKGRATNGANGGRTTDRRAAARCRGGYIAVTTWRAFIILAVIDITIDPAIVVPVGVDRPGQAADCRADRGTGQQVTAGNRGNASAAGCAKRRAGPNCRYVLTAWSSGAGTQR
jgi:hypothetical protein